MQVGEAMGGVVTGAPVVRESPYPSPVPKRRCRIAVADRAAARPLPAARADAGQQRGTILVGWPEMRFA